MARLASAEFAAKTISSGTNYWAPSRESNASQRLREQISSIDLKSLQACSLPEQEKTVIFEAIKAIITRRPPPTIRYLRFRLICKLLWSHTWCALVLFVLYGGGHLARFHSGLSLGVGVIVAGFFTLYAFIGMRREQTEATLSPIGEKFLEIYSRLVLDLVMMMGCVVLIHRSLFLLAGDSLYASVPADSAYMPWLWFGLDNLAKAALFDIPELYAWKISTIGYVGFWGATIVLATRLFLQFVILESLVQIYPVARSAFRYIFSDKNPSSWPWA